MSVSEVSVELDQIRAVYDVEREKANKALLELQKAQASMDLDWENRMYLEWMKARAIADQVWAEYLNKMAKIREKAIDILSLGV